MPQQIGRGWRIAAIILGFLFLWTAGAALVVVMGTQLIAIRWLGSALEDLPHPEEIFETMVDQHLEAGYEDPQPDPADPMLALRKIVITASINERTAKDVVTRLFLLDQRDPTTPIDLYISTQGGWTDSAFTISDAMRLVRAPVNTWAFGGCYSSGALLLISGTGRRYATEDAVIMVHANAPDSTEPFSGERLFRTRYERIWRQRSKVPSDWFPMTRDKVFYLSAPEALRFGLIDEVVSYDPRISK